MLQNISDFYGYTLAAADGVIGHVKDFYFDDQCWVVRYVVVDTGGWLPGRLVVLSPHALGTWNYAAKSLAVKLSQKQIEDSPSTELHKPVSRQYEVEYYRYYGWPAYWDGAGLWGFGGFPVTFPPSADELAGSFPHHHHREDKHLRSAKSITGYEIHAVDGALGSVHGFMMDDKSWAIRELVVEAGHWYAGKEIMVSTANVERISYEESQVFVNLSRAELQRTAQDDLAKAGV